MERLLLVLAALLVGGMMLFASFVAPDPRGGPFGENGVVETAPSHITENEWFKSEVINSDLPVLVDFYAVWCGPCKVLKKSIEEVRSTMGDQFKVVEVDAEQRRDLAFHFSIQSFPTVLLYVNGEIVSGFEGAVYPDELEQFLRQHLPQAEDQLESPGTDSSDEA